MSNVLKFERKSQFQDKPSSLSRKIATSIESVDTLLEGGIAHNRLSIFAEHVTFERLSLGQWLALNTNFGGETLYWSFYLSEDEIRLRWGAYLLGVTTLQLKRAIGGNNELLLRKWSKLEPRLRASRNHYFPYREWFDRFELAQGMKIEKPKLIVADFTSAGWFPAEIARDLDYVSSRFEVPSVALVNLSKYLPVRSVDTSQIEVFADHSALEVADKIIICQYDYNSQVFNINNLNLKLMA